MAEVRKVISVYLLPKELKKIRKYSDEESLSLSAAIRHLALRQLRYLEWENKGRPKRSRSKDGGVVAEKAPFVLRRGSHAKDGLATD